MKFKRQSQPEEGLNLTPLIDVVFLLLIFFMVSTSFQKETHMTIDLPEASATSSLKDPQQIEVVVNAIGEYTVNTRALLNTHLSTLKAALSDISEGDNQRALIITADARAPHQSVVRVMDAAGQLGFTRLSITTLNPSSDAEQ